MSPNLTNQLKQTKFFRPRATNDLVIRYRLFEKLDYGLQLPFTLISAPSGFGKSILISCWLERLKINHTWLSLDRSDSALTRFLQYFIEAIKKKKDSFGYKLISLLDAHDEPPRKMLILILINELAELKDDLVFVLDDYHFIHDKEVHQLIIDLMQFPLPYFHMVMVSRQDPPFPLIEWKKRNWLIEIRLHELIFTKEEIITFFAKSRRIVLKEKDAELLLKATEGWASGLRFLSLIINTEEDIENFISKHRHLHLVDLERIIHVFLQQQTPEIIEYILKSSILNRLNADLMDKICFEDNAQNQQISGKAVIEILERSNLFVIALDNKNEWYRYHPMFHNIIRNKAKVAYSEKEIQQIHYKTAEWLIKYGYTEAAIKYYVLANQWGKAILNFNNYRKFLLNDYKWNTLIQLIQLFPVALQNKDSILKITKAWIFMYQLKFNEFFQILDLIEPWHFILAPDKKEKANLIGELNTLLAYETYNTSIDFKLCLKQSRKAISKLNQENSYVRGLAWIFIGGALQVEKGMAVALNAIYKGMGKERSILVHSQQYLTINYLYWIDANLAGLLKTSEQLILLGKAHGLIEAIVNGQLFIGTAQYYMNNLEAAYETFKNAYKKRYNTPGVHHAFISIAYAHTCFETGKIKEAFNIANELNGYANQSNSKFLSLLAQSLLADLWWREGKHKKAIEWINVTSEIPIYPLSNYNSFNLIYVKILVYQGRENNKRALKMLDELQKMLELTKNKRFLPEVHACKAIIYANEARESETFQHLHKAVDLLRLGKFIRVFIDLGPKMFELLKNYTSQFGKLPYQNEIFSAFEHKIRAIRKVSTQLTIREKEVLQLMHAKLSNKEIGNKLFISEKTVKRHSGNIFKKLECKNRKEAAEKAVELRIV